jgi:hypothetical protein
MNDFTKDELVMMRYCVMHDRTSEYSVYKAELISKIKNMIENYCNTEKCNHEWVSLFVVDEENLRVLGGAGYKCLKCEKIIPHEWGRNE